MVTLVVLINILISVMLLYIALQIWQLKGKIVAITNQLNSYEGSTHELLRTASENLYTEQEQIYNLRQKYQNIKLQIQQVQQILNLIILGRKIWRRYL